MTGSVSLKFGFKLILADNWQDADETVLAFNIPHDKWVRLFLGPRLNGAVPKEIAALYEVARGEMIYGWYFYPLLHQGIAQCYRVVESAVREKASQSGILKELLSRRKSSQKRKQQFISFSEIISALSSRKLLSCEAGSRFNLARELRNQTSHPTSQDQLPPGMALDILKFTAYDINEMFPA